MHPGRIHLHFYRSLGSNTEQMVRETLARLRRSLQISYSWNWIFVWSVLRLAYKVFLGQSLFTRQEQTRAPVVESTTRVISNLF